MNDSREHKVRGLARHRKRAKESSELGARSAVDDYNAKRVMP